VVLPSAVPVSDESEESLVEMHHDALLGGI
jgi:hypothetical protein